MYKNGNYFQGTNQPPLAWPAHAQWKPSIHMPRWACRIVLEITMIRLQRLHEISTFDAEDEGVDPFSIDADTKDGETAYQACFWALWKNINGAGSWRSNPFVWAINFRRVDE